MGMQLRRIGLLEQEAEAGAITTSIIRFAAASAGNTQDITTAGFGTPKAVLFIGVNAKTDGTAADHLIGSVGATDGTNHWNVGFRSVHNETSFEPDADGYGDTSRLLAFINHTGENLSGSATFDSFITDGVRIQWNNEGTVDDHDDFLVTAVFIGGAAVSVDVGTVAMSTQDTAVTTTTGFETKALITSNRLGGFGGFSKSIRFGMGFGSWDGATLRQNALDNGVNDADSPTNPLGVVNSSGVTTRAANTNYIEMGNVISTSFDLTGRGEDWTGRSVGYLAIGGVEAWTGIENSPTATGDHDFTGPSFTPTSGLILTNMLDAVDTAQSGAKAGAFGVAAFDGGGEYSAAWAEEAGLTTTDNQSLSDDTAVHLTDHQGTQTFLASFERFLSNGVRLNFSVADATVRKWPTLFLR